MDKCLGFGDYKKCNTCYRLTSKSIGFEQNYIIPVVSHDGNCLMYEDDASWQDPKRDKAVSQNGNNAEHYDLSTRE